MKTLMVTLFAAILFASCSKPAQAPAGHEENEQLVKATDSTGKVYYTCPMHPSVISDKPGACPVCGMALVKKTGSPKASEAEIKSLRAVSLSPVQRVMANVQTAPVRRQPFEHNLNAVGVIDYAEPNQARVTARFRGRIQRLFVNFTGDVVKKGQPLFELYSPDLATAENDYILALNARDAGTQRGAGALDGAGQGDLVSAAQEKLLVHFGLTKQQVDAVAKTRQSSSSVVFYSPIQGTVTAKDVQEGQYVEEGTQLYQLADLSRVWAYLDVYEKDLSSFRVGQTVAIRTDAYPGRDFAGRVAFIDPSVDPQTRTVRVRVELDNRQGLLKPQMYVRALANMRMKETLVVPRSAILITGKRNVVWVEVEPNQFEPRDVQTGMSDDANVEVLSGVSEGEMVAVSGGFLLDSESSLQAPASADPHAGHNMQKQGDKMPGMAPAEDAPHTDHAVQPSASHEPREIPVAVDAAYEPEQVTVHKGEHVRLAFTRKSDENCTGEVVFPSLNIRKKLPVGKTTVVELMPTEPGTIPFQCGMGMVSGSVVVE